MYIVVLFIVTKTWRKLRSPSVSEWINQLCCICCCCSVAQSCPTLCDPMDCSSQASLSLPISQSLPKFMFTASVMPSSHLILWCPLLLPSVFPSFPWWLYLLLSCFSCVQLCATLWTAALQAPLFRGFSSQEN